MIRHDATAPGAVPATVGADETGPRIDGARLWQSLMELAKIGATARGGVNRLALTDLDRLARDQFCRWCVPSRGAPSPLTEWAIFSHADPA